MKKSVSSTAMLLLVVIAGASVANAQTVHVAGASASSQFLTAAIGSDQLALTGVPARKARITGRRRTPRI
jgi:hypothetical protein